MNIFKRLVDKIRKRSRASYRLEALERSSIINPLEAKLSREGYPICPVCGQVVRIHKESLEEQNRRGVGRIIINCLNCDCHMFVKL